MKLHVLLPAHRSAFARRRDFVATQTKQVRSLSFLPRRHQDSKIHEEII